MAHFLAGHQILRVTRGGEHPGLRTSQIGSLHAISSHFTLRDDPCLTVLPTGAGKTAVLMLVPYVLPASRALVITQSKFVRNQIANDFRSLRTLKGINALPPEFDSPKLKENRHKLLTPGDWETLGEFDVVVTTPSSASPAITGVESPPKDLFDLVLVDEAHHSPAKTWNALIKAFPSARVVFFTATPFRRDRKEIKARHLYTYPIQKAYEDGIYGEMVYLPVATTHHTSSDVALAHAAERTFEEDAKNGFTHSIMVRVESRRRAAELQNIYATETHLKLEVIDSGKSQRTAERTIGKLTKGDIDGVICVNMLGEGFDLPRLKIAVLHSPHRSLAVTLQFFGRFARVNGDGLGEAKFLAVPSEMDDELLEVFDESDTWGKKIRLLGQQRIGAEVATQDFLQAFEAVETDDANPPTEDVSLHSFTVFNHVKAHEVHGTVNLFAEPRVTGFVTERVWVNEEERTVVFLLREEVRPQWATTPGLDRVEHHLVVAYWDEDSGIVFVCSSYREEALYKEVVGSFIEGHCRALSLNKTNRVLRSFKNLELFHVGIRNRATGVVAESYRQIAGTSAQYALDKSDAALYHRGHIFGRGETPNGVTTIGVSSLGKIWRLEQTKIPELIGWCQSLAADISNSAPVITGIQIDHFDVGQDIEEIPDEVVLAVDWDEQVYKHPWKVEYVQTDGTTQSCNVLEFDLTVAPQRIGPCTVHFELSRNGWQSMLAYRLEPVPSVTYVDNAQPKIDVVKGFSKVDLTAYLSEEHLRFHFADGSVLQGSELFSPMGEEPITFDALELAQAIDWSAESVNVKKEYGETAEGDESLTIHEWLKKRLRESTASTVLYDHRPGEAADFIAVSAGDGERIRVELYHCKASGSEDPGDRTKDTYELAGQAIKSTKYRNKRTLLKHIKDRVNTGSVFVKGSLEETIELIEPDPRHELPLDVFLVQPGFSKSDMSAKISSILMGVNRALVSVGCSRPRLLCSA
jgi:superfamily II DNA or RNA helicase